MPKAARNALNLAGWSLRRRTQGRGVITPHLSLCAWREQRDVPLTDAKYGEYQALDARRRSDLHRRFIETDCWLQLEATETRRLEGAKKPGIQKTPQGVFRKTPKFLCLPRTRLNQRHQFVCAPDEIVTRHGSIHLRCGPIGCGRT
jgi:hypothetical protein